LAPARVGDHSSGHDGRGIERKYLKHYMGCEERREVRNVPIGQDFDDVGADDRKALQRTEQAERLGRTDAPRAWR